MRYYESERITKETKIKIVLDLDGDGAYSISTEIPFLDHMLSAFAKHSGITLNMVASGDIEVDFHHTIEDCGIALGEAFHEALGDKRGIERFGNATTPLDEALTRVVLDLSGRPFIHFGLEFSQSHDGNGINPYLFEEFFRGFANGARATIHIDSIRGRNSHHILESAFKAFAKAMRQAIEVTSESIPSTKGVL